jgi:hypothetical protein
MMRTVGISQYRDTVCVLRLYIRFASLSMHTLTWITLTWITQFKCCKGCGRELLGG